MVGRQQQEKGQGYLLHSSLACITGWMEYHSLNWINSWPHHRAATCSCVNCALCRAFGWVGNAESESQSMLCLPHSTSWLRARLKKHLLLICKKKEPSIWLDKKSHLDFLISIAGIQESLDGMQVDRGWGRLEVVKPAAKNLDGGGRGWRKWMENRKVLRTPKSFVFPAVAVAGLSWTPGLQARILPVAHPSCYFDSFVACLWWK